MTTSVQEPAGGLLAFVEAEQSVQKICKAMKVREKLPPEMRSELDTMLNSDRYTTSVIHRALTAHGYQLGRDAVARHRRGECGCR